QIATADLDEPPRRKLDPLDGLAHPGRLVGAATQELGNLESPAVAEARGRRLLDDGPDALLTGRKGFLHLLSLVDIEHAAVEKGGLAGVLANHLTP
ncbi:hypothetical protein DF186_14815, partial [Enterococcus hirae]